MHESACSIREEKKTPRVFHLPSHFEIFTTNLKAFAKYGAFLLTTFSNYVLVIDLLILKWFDFEKVY